jgi:LPPG:FO 2-phospho-L-lactate transferase
VLSGGIYINPFAAVLCGGVGGARMARALSMVLDPRELTAIVNVGDDDTMYGAHVSADVDTVVYTLAGIEGEHGWGVRSDTFHVMDGLSALGVDTSFRLGDRDLAHCLWRTERLHAGDPLSSVTADMARALGIRSHVVPVTDDPIRTRIRSTTDRWLSFQEYFVLRGYRDDVAEVVYEGAGEASPAPGVVDAIDDAGLVVIAPSNPPLSIWPILAVPGVGDALQRRDRVIAVSPLFGGVPLKGPADRVMAALGLPRGNAGVLAAYESIVTDLVVDEGDASDVAALSDEARIHVTDTRIGEPDAAKRFAAWLLETFA